MKSDLAIAAHSAHHLHALAHLSELKRALSDQPRRHADVRHQDRNIAVRHRIDVDGFGSRSVKSGMVFVGNYRTFLASPTRGQLEHSRQMCP
jgi:hypothetical protein